MTVESFRRVKTGIEDLEKLREVKQSLVSQDAADRLRQRARIRRQYNSPPLSQPVVSAQSQTSPTSDTPYRVERYDPDSDLWRVHFVGNPSESFLAKPLRAGGIETGTIVRGYPPNFFEPNSQGRRFKPIEEPKPTKVKEIRIEFQVGHTGRK